MRTRRKIWSIPIALAVVLAFAVLLGVSQYVQAQTPDPAPVTATPFVDVEITLQTGVSNPSEDHDPTTQTSLGDAFSDMDGQDPPQANMNLAYTALSTDPGVVTVTLTGDSGAEDGAARVWWDSLGTAGVDAQDGPLPDTDCTKRQAALGDSVFEEDEDNEAADAEDTNPAATGYCQDFEDIDVDDGDPVLNPSLVIVQAFHWNMLTGPEMKYAGEAGGLTNPDGYKVPFSGLSADQRDEVEELYTMGVLARGIGGFAFTNRGSDQDPAGNAGAATVTVKISDSIGRFLEKSVGRSFDVTVNPDALGQLSLLEPNEEDGVGYRALDVATDGTEMEVEPFGDTVNVLEFTISNTTTTIATITVSQVRPGDEDFASNDQKVNFSLTDGNNLPFQIKKINARDADGDGDTLDVGDQLYNEAEIVVRPWRHIDG